MTTATKTKSGITLSNFRVVYHAPRYEGGRVLYDGYCAILADDAEHDGAEVRVFDVPDVDEGQLAAAMFACDAMNQHERLMRVTRLAQYIAKQQDEGLDITAIDWSDLREAVFDATTTSK